MRKIKYRGYDKISDSWMFGGGVVRDADIKGRYWLMFSESEGAIIDDHKTIGEYTGILDKNGNEIYEGDIVEWEDSTAEDYCAGAVVYPKEEVEFNGGSFYPVCMMPGDEFEIIGNIHEHKKTI